MTLITLPVELTRMISDHLDIPSLASLLRANDTLCAHCAEPFRRRAIADDCGLTALREAVFSEDYDLAKLLLSFGAKPNEAASEDDETLITPLHIAVLRRNARLCHLLVQNGAAVEAKFTKLRKVLRDFPRIQVGYPYPVRDFKFPLEIAVCAGNPEVVRIILDAMELHENDTNRLRESFRTAVRLRISDIVDVFFAWASGKKTFVINEFLIGAVEVMDLEAAERALQAGANPRQSNWHPLHLLSNEDHLLLTLLLRYGAEVDAFEETRYGPNGSIRQRRTALMGAIFNRDKAKLLVEWGADIDLAIKTFHEDRTYPAAAATLWLEELRASGASQVSLLRHFRLFRANYYPDLFSTYIHIGRFERVDTGPRRGWDGVTRRRLTPIDTMLFTMTVLQRWIDGRTWWRSSGGKGRQASGLFAFCLVCFFLLSHFLLLSCFSLSVCFLLFSSFFCGRHSALVSDLLENTLLGGFLPFTFPYAVPWLSFVFCCIFRLWYVLAVCAPWCVWVRSMAVESYQIVKHKTMRTMSNVHWHK